MSIRPSSTIGVEALTLRSVPGAHPAAGHARSAIAIGVTWATWTAPAGAAIPTGTAAMPAGTTIPARATVVPARPAIPARTPAPAIMRSGFGRGGRSDTRYGDQTGTQDSKKFHNALLPVIPPVGEHGRRMANRR